MNFFEVTLEVKLRRDILDPAGRAVETSLLARGFAANNVRIGKIITFTLEAEGEAQARAQASSMAETLLSNTVMEDYTIRLSPTE